MCMSFLCSAKRWIRGTIEKKEMGHRVDEFELGSIDALSHVQHPG